DPLPLRGGLGPLADVVLHLRDRLQERDRVTDFAGDDPARVDVAVVEPREDGLPTRVDHAGVRPLELEYLGVGPHGRAAAAAAGHRAGERDLGIARAPLRRVADQVAPFLCAKSGGGKGDPRDPPGRYDELHRILRWKLSRVDRGADPPPRTADPA